jgi:dsRNA-specific ribonuclease
MLTTWFTVDIRNNMARLLCNANLAEICERHGIDRCINLPAFARGVTGRAQRADAIEAIIGAVDLDSNGEQKVLNVEGVMDVLGLK